MNADIYRYRPYLFSIAYNLLGEVEAAEDIVQDAFEKWLKLDHSRIRNEKAYLSRIVVNTSISRMEEAKREREAYKGVWLPEPVIGEEITADDHTLDYAVMFLLERLNPYERAVLVLRESFELEYEEIAEFINVTNDNCRQIFHRAKAKITTPVARKKNADDEQRKQLFEAFLAACHTENLDRLRQVLKNDIVLYSDGGGKVPAALNPLAGVDIVSEFLLGLIRKADKSLLWFKPVLVNGSPAGLVYHGNELLTLAMINMEGGGIQNVFFMRNPDKIRLHPSASLKSQD